MPDLLISFYVDGPHSAPVGQRIWSDGLAEAYRTSWRKKTAEGEYVTVKGQPGWYRITELDENRMAAVREAIAGIDPAVIPSVIDTVTDTRTDTSFAEWHICYETEDGPVHKDIRVVQWGTLAPEAAPLMPLLIKVNSIINSALVVKN